MGRTGLARDMRIRRAREGPEFGGEMGEYLNRDDYKGKVCTSGIGPARGSSRWVKQVGNGWSLTNASSLTFRRACVIHELTEVMSFLSHAEPHHPTLSHPSSFMYLLRRRTYLRLQDSSLPVFAKSFTSPR